jgi:deoxyhypusine synthase
LSFTGNLVATGLRGLLSRFIGRGFVDAVVTTAGALDHDIAKSMGGEYLLSSFDADDAAMAREGIHRIGNVAVRREHYGVLVERFLHTHLGELALEKGTWGVRELLWRLGEHIDDDYSILGTAARSRVPIYVPGFVDGAFGTAILTYNESQRVRSSGKPILIDPLRDERELMDIAMSSKRLGALVVGGGISKHHVIWWGQFRGGFDYLVYVSTAVEWDGSLSGASPREAVSWYKLKPTGKGVFVHADATVVLPIILPYIASRLKYRERVVVIDG